MNSVRITFEGSLGHALAARLDAPAGAARGHALFAHCFTCSKDAIAARLIAEKLASRGIGVLRFDFTGLGPNGFANASPALDKIIQASNRPTCQFSRRPSSSW